MYIMHVLCVRRIQFHVLLIDKSSGGVRNNNIVFCNIAIYICIQYTAPEKCFWRQCDIVVTPPPRYNNIIVNHYTQRYELAYGEMSSTGEIYYIIILCVSTRYCLLSYNIFIPRRCVLKIRTRLKLIRGQQRAQLF